MANGITYGINFPFLDSKTGKYLSLSETTNDEIRSNLIHLLLTRKGSRYFLPDFGTRIYEFIFEPLDGPTFNDIESDIKDSVEKYIPNLLINSISITPLVELEEDPIAVNTNPDLDPRIYLLPGRGTKEYTAKVKVEYTITNDVFNSKDFVIINI
jgi:phage baseplate assembly protein W